MGVATAVSVVAALQRQRCSTLRCIDRRYNESLASLVLSGNPLGDKGGRSLMRLQYTRSGKVRRVPLVSTQSTPCEYSEYPL
jgi:hypothetical protein